MPLLRELFVHRMTQAQTSQQEAKNEYPLLDMGVSPLVSDDSMMRGVCGLWRGTTGCTTKDQPDMSDIMFELLEMSC